MSQIDMNLIEHIVKRLANSKAVSLNISIGDSKLHIVRGGSSGTDAKLNTFTNTPKEIDQSGLELQDNDAQVEVSAQLVGYFRCLRMPVVIGQSVVQGQPIGNIDSMNIMNEVSSPVNGIISNILVSEGDAVQYGTMLFTISVTEASGVNETQDSEVGI